MHKRGDWVKLKTTFHPIFKRGEWARVLSVSAKEPVKTHFGLLQIQQQHIIYQVIDQNRVQAAVSNFEIE